ncbi:helix-turn-helix transcriptional regulator [Catenovulum sp. SM1970]|uniref:helix-turn-helix domain-containing protein n=1 Tax=Marinifaba aquimaris TaxID=2741323 RepID=UPI0015733797|nr:AraC family transcriptional regulator [Marinifaba aquimaris]NTS78523.1 helix-turn-helix transcriptional regulator [Marinifaba aquimaris]
MPTISKPLCEKIIPDANTSWRYWLYEVESLDFHWHYHPEYEICLTLNSFGQRYIGDDIQYYDDLDLVLLGPNLPHAWRSDDSIKGSLQQVYVAQIPVLLLESLMKTSPECLQLKGMLIKSKKGLAFSNRVAKQSKSLFEQMSTANDIERFILLMQLLNLLQQDDVAKTLSSDNYSFTEASDTSQDKIERVLKYLDQHYNEAVTAEDMANLTHMSTNHFHRFFKQKTEQTFGEHLTKLRIGKACALLQNTELPINHISDSCGFNNMSNFNRRFLQHKACTPSEFRKTYARTS